MQWHVVWHNDTVRELRAIGAPVAKQIIEKITNYLSQSPTTLGKSLSGNYKQLYRYRYGNYRVLYRLDHDNNTITILAVGHRKDVYSTQFDSL